MGNDPTTKIKFKKNLKFLGLTLVLCLVAWFGVKIIVTRVGATDKATNTAASNSRQNEAVLQLGGNNTGGLRTGGGPPLD